MHAHHPRSLIPGLLAVVYILCAVALTVAWAQGGDQPPAVGDSGGTLDEVYAAIMSGRWSWLAGFGLIVVIEPVKRWLMGVGVFAGEVQNLADAKPRIAILRTDLGGLVLAFVVSAVTGVAVALLAGELWTGATVLGILRNAVVAVGGYTAIKRLVLERLGLYKVAASLPAIASPPLGAKPSDPIPA